MKAMDRLRERAGPVVNVQPKVSIAEVTFPAGTCSAAIILQPISRPSSASVQGCRRVRPFCAGERQAGSHGYHGNGASPSFSGKHSVYVNLGTQAGREGRRLLPHLPNSRLDGRDRTADSGYQYTHVRFGQCPGTLRVE